MARHLNPGIWWVAITFVAAAPGNAVAAPQTFNTALPVTTGNFVYRQQFLYLRAADGSGPTDRDLRVGGGVSALGYGVSSRLAAFAALPYLHKRLSHGTATGDTARRRTRGIGDIRLWSRYTLVQQDAPGRTFRIAPFAGIEAPTGRDDDQDRRGRLPQPLQIGSGSWDPFFGVVATYQSLDFQVDAQAGYKLNTRANDFEFGDELRLDASIQHRLWPRELGAGLPGFLYGVAEVNFSHQEKSRSDGSRVPNSGGHKVFFSPGLQYVTRQWIVEGVVQIPLTQDLDGTALEDDFIARLGFRLNF